MPSTKTGRRNLNRFRKVYPYIRRSPKYVLMTDKQTIIEVAKLSFSNQNSVTYSFKESFPSIPYVTVSSVDSFGNDSADVNVFITSLSTATVTVETSQAFTGTVHLQAMWVES